MQQEKLKRGSATDHLANERTFLAWVRTGIAIMAFGFVVVKFSLFLRQMALMFTDHPIKLSNQQNAGVTGLVLVILGVIITILGYIRYKNIEKQLNNNQFSSSSTLILILTLSIVIGSIILILYLVPNV